MQHEFYKKLQSALSIERLGVYGQDEPGCTVTMARYLWNIALCESLYSPLQMCEVALRNAIHATMADFYQTDAWYDTADLLPWGHEQVGSAKKKIAKARHSITSGRVVAELHFGFWTSLFEDHYERKATFLPRGIKKVFPQLPKSQHNRKHIKARLERIRILRNRVFHHERVIHWKDLAQQHGQIVQTIGWISPELEEMALKLDRFAETHRAGIDPWINQLQNHWPAKPSPRKDGQA